MTSEKQCSKCKQVKPLSDFYKQKSCKDGYRPDCKNCHGKPTPQKTIAEKFNERIDKSHDCWEWTSYIDSYGYGQLWHDGVLILSHRISYELHNGAIPANMHVLHKCDNPTCVNPDHLFMGTHKDNMKDRDNKGRVCHGTNHKDARLNPSAVRDIRRKYKDGMTISELAKEYGISSPSIKKVVTRKTWSRVL